MMGRFARIGMAVRCLMASAVLAGPVVARPAPPQAAPAPTRAADATVKLRPNIIVILADDMGFSDIGPFGSEIPTPNLDRLAAGGIRFTQFYNAARCSPSRASLLTGLYPHQAGLGHLEGRTLPDAQGVRGKLLPRAVTAAEVLGANGYLTAMAGKWHLGLAQGVGPKVRGFQRALASPVGELYFPDQKNGRGEQHVVFLDGKRTPANAPEVGNGYWYSSDMFVDWGLRFAREAKAQDKPFFLYLPMVAAHFPLMAPAQDVARFKGKYMAGWDALREERLKRMKANGIVAANIRLTRPLPVAYDWSKLSMADQDRFDTIMAVYAATISRMDKAIGDLMTRLEAEGQLDNTLILFMSDNGGNAESGPDGRLQGTGKPGSVTSNVWAGLNWATLQNAPFSYFKHYMEEGGIASPLIAYWPKGIAPQQRGAIVRDPGHLIDVMPTLRELSGAPYPDRFKGQAILPEEGRSFAPAFRGQPLTRSTPIFWEHEGNRAVRDGKWKLIAQFDQSWRLYDMDADRSELTDLADNNPAIVKRMAAQWDAWVARSFVDRWPNKERGGVVPGRLERAAGN
jgi:arylsulfatase A-like enzyme